MSVWDEKDKRIYPLSGNTAGITAVNRVTLQGKKVKPKGAGPLTREAKRLTKNFGTGSPQQAAPRSRKSP